MNKNYQEYLSVREKETDIGFAAADLRWDQ